MTEGFSPSTHSRSQTKSRFTLLDVGSFDDRTPEGRTRWRALLGSFEPELVLLEARPGDVCKILAPYLFWRTSGVIGSVSALLREGAALAIERGAERLSESLLDEVEVDADAEGEAARRTRPTASTLAAKPS